MPGLILGSGGAGHDNNSFIRVFIPILKMLLNIEFEKLSANINYISIAIIISPI